MAADAIHHLCIDLETYSDVDIGKAGLYKYAQSPAFEVLLFAYSLDGAPVRVVDLAKGEKIPVAMLGYLFDSSTQKHAFNASFEVYCLSRYFKLHAEGAELYGMTYHDWLSQWRCTMLHGMYLGYPRRPGRLRQGPGAPPGQAEDGHR